VGAFLIDQALMSLKAHGNLVEQAPKQKVGRRFA
jgi:hypothetical protein